MRELTAAPRAALNDTNRLSQPARDLLLLARSADDDTYIDAEPKASTACSRRSRCEPQACTRDEMTPG